jgi:GT2 family glycosyltransferase
MVRLGDLPAAWSSLATVEPQLNANVHQFILINDPADRALVDRFAARAATTIIEPGKNLGVARGRNRLIDDAVDWGAEYIISLDDDLLVPADFVESLLTRMQSSQEAGIRLGVAMPAVFDFHAVAPDLMSADEIESTEAGNLQEFPPTRELRRHLQGIADDESGQALYHAGIRDWRTNYFRRYAWRATSVSRLIDDGLGRPPAESEASTERRHDPDTLLRIRKGDPDPIEVATTPGGACAYPTGLIEAIGLIDEAFSPFGYEDADFSIRANRAGFTNVLLPSELVLHDIAARKRTRPGRVQLYTQGKARALIARNHLSGRDTLATLIETVVVAPFHTADRVYQQLADPSASVLLAALLSYLGGFVEGLFRPTRIPTTAGRGAASEVDTAGPARSGDISLEGVHVPAWDRAPLSGLPPDIATNVRLAYRFDEAIGRLDLERLAIDAPGLGRVELSLALTLPPGSRDGDMVSPDEVSLQRLEVKVEDTTFLTRLQTNVAWARDERTTGYLIPLVGPVRSRRDAQRATFLAPRTEPAAMRLVMDPHQSVTVADLMAADTSGRPFDDLVGLRIWFGSSDPG